MKESLFRRAILRWGRLIVGHPWALLGVSLLVTVVASYIVATRFDIRSDLKDLMPEHARSVQDTLKVADRMGSITTLSILVEAPDRQLVTGKKDSDEYRSCQAVAVEEWRASQQRSLARSADPTAAAGSEAVAAGLGEPPAEVTAHCDDALILFAQVLVDRLQSMDNIGYAHFRNDRTFFEENLLLYASVEDLEQLYSEVDEGLTEARRMSGEYKACLLTAMDPADCEGLEPTLALLQQRRIEAHTGPDLGSGSHVGDALAEEESGAPLRKSSTPATLDEASLRAEFRSKYEASGIDFHEYMIYELPDGARAAKIQVRFRDATTSLKANEKNLAEMDEVIAALDPTSYHPELTVAYGGGFRSQKEEASAIVSDVKMSGGTTIAGIVLLLLLFFRRLRATVILLVPLAMSIVWTFALTFVTIGYLNLITAFIAAILLGLGIDFGIHLLVRFDQERTLGRSTDEAMLRAVSEVGAANTAGAATTAATFLTLATADFRGFSQFGIVACLGVMLSLITMLSVLPALVIAWQRVWPTQPLRLRGTVVPSTAGRYWLRPVAIGLGVVLLLSAALSVSSVDDIGFEENFLRLGMKQDKWKKDSNRYKMTEGTRHSSPAIVLTNSLSEVAALERIVMRLKDPHVHFNMRAVAARYPHLFVAMDDLFGTAISFSPKHAAWPAMALSRRVASPGWWTMPKYNRYDGQATQVLWRLNRFVDTYPVLAGRLQVALGPALDVSGDYRILPELASLHRTTPAWLQGALPTRRISQRLSSVRDFASIFSFMPGTAVEQVRKLEVIERLRERTQRRNIRFLPKADQQKVKDLRRFLVQSPISVDDLPTWVKLQFKEGGVHPAEPRPGSGVDFAFGNVALVYQSTSSMIGEESHRFTGEMRSIEVGGSVPAMSTNGFVFSDMLHQIETDGLKVAYIALLIVVMVVLIQFRSPAQTLVVVAPLLVALTWVGGLMALFDLKLGLFNLVMLPVIIGIGIDNGIHLYHRYQENGHGGLFGALRFTGGSIVMTSATTMVGFGGLTLSQHMGLNSMGELALIGIGACWLATLTVQPVLLVLAEWMGVRTVIGDRAYVPHSALED